MNDPMTLSDERLKNMIRRTDRGELTPGEWAAILNEHRVSRTRLRRAGDEIDRERTGARQFLRECSRDFGLPLTCILITCMAIQAISLAALTGCVIARIYRGD